MTAAPTQPDIAQAEPSLLNYNACSDSRPPVVIFLHHALIFSPAFFNFFLQSELSINACAQKRRSVERLASGNLLPPR